MRKGKKLGLWGLLRQYVREFEIANKADFGEGAWQRIKQLERDIIDYYRDHETEPLRKSNVRLQAERDKLIEALRKIRDWEFSRSAYTEPERIIDEVFIEIGIESEESE